MFVIIFCCMVLTVFLALKFVFTWLPLRQRRHFLKLRTQGRHEEACRVAERLAGTRRPVKTEQSARFRLFWADSASNVNDPKSLSLVQDVIQSGYCLVEAHGFAGFLYSNAGNLEEALRHYRIEHQLASQRNRPDYVMRSLGSMAHLMAQEGRFDEAKAMCNQLLETDPANNWIVANASTTCLVYEGRFEAAIDAYRDLLTHPELEKSLQSRVEALLALGRTELTIGNVSDALTYMETALVTLPSSSVIIRCTALKACAMALQGQESDARSALAFAEQQLEAYLDARGLSKEAVAIWPPPPAGKRPEDDPAPESAAFAARRMMIECYGTFGKTAFALSDWERSLGYWNRVFTLKPDRALQPSLWYWIGEAYEQMQASDKAREAFAQAIMPEINTYHARLARERLQELDASVQ